MNPWDQRPGESSKQYKAFLDYLELGRRRSYDQAYRKTYAKPPHYRAPNFFRAWAHRFQWEDRAQAWDIHLEEEQRQAEIEATREEARKQVQTRMQAYQMVMSTGVTVISKADLPNLTPAQARGLLRHAITAIDIGAKGMRLEFGEITERQAVSITMGGQANVHDHEPDFDRVAAILSILEEAGAIPPISRMMGEKGGAETDEIDYPPAGADA